MDFAFWTIDRLSHGLQRGDYSAVELARSVLDRIAILDRRLHAFVRTTEARALKDARASDQRRAAGRTFGSLDGIPYAVKDIFDVEGEPTMCGVSFLADAIAARDCNAVQRLSAAGMILVGKTHTHQFACDITGINPDQGTPHNPWLEEHLIPGGSSSGSAVAVTAGMVPVALGSDTGGSIRVPAALCGITGFKPTVGLAGRGGVHPLSLTRDTIGPLSRTARDAALVFSALIGLDERDSATFARADNDVMAGLDSGVAGFTIAICVSHYLDGCDPDGIRAMEAAAAILQDRGATITPAKFPEITEAWEDPRHYTVLSAEANAVNGNTLDRHRTDIDPGCFWMEDGKGVSARAYYNALQARDDLIRRLSERMAGVDAFLAPTTVAPAWSVAKVARGEEPRGGYTHNASVGNVLNLPGVSVPARATDAGLPVGLTIHAAPFSDAITLRIANALQSVAPDLLRVPNLAWAFT